MPDSELRPLEWELDSKVVMARANYMACAYNAAVNHGTDRGVRKMRDLIEAINHCERVEGTVRLGWLVGQGVIAGYRECGAGCHVRPGGLFHEPGCENESNHPVYKARMAAVRDALPVRYQWAASVTLVGH